MSIFACVFVHKSVFILCLCMCVLLQNQQRRWIFVRQILKQHVRIKAHPSPYKAKQPCYFSLHYKTRTCTLAALRLSLQKTSESP